jgi:hypothetical protein
MTPDHYVDATAPPAARRMSKSRSTGCTIHACACARGCFCNTSPIGRAHAQAVLAHDQAPSLATSRVVGRPVSRARVRERSGSGISERPRLLVMCCCWIAGGVGLRRGRVVTMGRACLGRFRLCPRRSSLVAIGEAPARLGVREHDPGSRFLPLLRPFPALLADGAEESRTRWAPGPMI